MGRRGVLHLNFDDSERKRNQALGFATTSINTSTAAYLPKKLRTLQAWTYFQTAFTGRKAYG